MSFQQSAVDLIRQTETKLGSLIADALKARAYDQVAAVAELADAVAAIGKHSGMHSTPAAGVAADGPATASWMQPRYRSTVNPGQ